ncbi:hypothetical protein BH708_14625 [Brachybacterium sp. P6-10-X1]|uniref:hypothetical protein n=1 Tax=Brachybacterium sp. P6-10-X1 TaxID=1903186 RepID=UPI000971BB15|nr:hypothetical protein [Brachybacterium sp. P6-10-X1]APX33741.1 hypothetical protein BH708_14625 [Brachybacterium sp. P6-10-X1]
MSESDDVLRGSDDRDLTVYFHREQAQERLERTTRSAGIIRITMTLGAVVIILVGVIFLDPVASYLVIALGIVEGLLALFYLPTILLRAVRDQAAVRTSGDDAVFVLAEHGLRRTTDDGPPREIPYADVTLQRVAPSSATTPGRLSVQLPEENLDLSADLLHPEIDEILGAYERLSADSGSAA